MNNYIFLLKYDFSKILHNRSNILRVFPDMANLYEGYAKCSSCSRNRIGRSVLVNILDMSKYDENQKRVLKTLLPTDVYRNITK